MYFPFHLNLLILAGEFYAVTTHFTVLLTTWCSWYSHTSLFRHQDSSYHLFRTTKNSGV